MPHPDAKKQLQHERYQLLRQLTNWLETPTLMLVLTGVVLLGAAGMYAFEKDMPGGLRTYPEALWWTAMLLTSMGSDYWPRTGEGRTLCFLLALYGFAVFGYFTATLASFFMGRDTENPKAEAAGAAAVEALHEEVRQLRAELRQTPSANTAAPPSNH